MIVTVEEFREAFPAFTEEEFPQAAVHVRLLLAEKFFDKKIWPDEDVRKHVAGLYAAHYLTVTKEGSALGAVSSKSVDGVSVSYDTGSSSEAGAGFWNATPYGRELYKLFRIFGAGAVQL